MNISGTLHFYSGDDKELFFVFDDDVAQQLYKQADFDIEDLNSRRAYISVGTERFIHRRTLSFSRKQTEIKISLSSRTTKNNLGALTALYDWYAARGRPHPAPFAVLGTLRKVAHDGERVWELYITEPADLVVPPGLSRRTKEAPSERRSYAHRRQFVQRDLGEIGRVAERKALALAQTDFPGPGYSCFWRDRFLDSERIEIRKMGVIADIDVWNVSDDKPELFVEVKAQKIPAGGSDPAFYLSTSEWRSFKHAGKAKIRYEVWLFQYRDIRHFTQAFHRVELVIFDELNEDWLQPDSYMVTPGPAAGTRYALSE